MNEARQAKLNQALERILLTLAAEYRPEKVILFGSMAQAAVGEWSDLDLVIIKDTSKPFLQRLKEVALLCHAPVGVDFLVYTPSEFDQMIAERNPFILEECSAKAKCCMSASLPQQWFDRAREDLQGHQDQTKTRFQSEASFRLRQAILASFSTPSADKP
jgi:predicted nucleotidyltransferase